MSELEIQVVPEVDQAGERRGCIRLKGIFLLPANTTYRIDPLDSSINTSIDWPSGDRRADETRLGPSGVEILIGPDVVDAAQLRAGTPVSISVPAAAIRQDLRWPDFGGPDVDAFDLEKVPQTPPPLPPEHTLAQQPSPPPPPRATPPDTEGLAQLRRVPEPPASEPVAMLQPAPTPADKTLAVAAAHPPSPAAGAATPTRRSSLFFPFFFGFFAAATLTLLTWSSLRQEFGGAASVAQGGGGLTATAKPQLPVAAPLDDVFKVTNESPRGRSASGVTLTQALALADENLYSDTPDPEEARFWLRTAGAMVLGEDRMKWALTQLGAIYARDGSQESFARARALWQLAGAQGDPVALCFLAKLHEHGLGVPKNRLAALSHYEQAQRQGGCQGVDAAIQRLKSAQK